MSRSDEICPRRGFCPPGHMTIDGIGPLPGKGPSVLRAVVVDDEANLRLLARYVLEDDGFAEVVGEACTACDAERMIRELAPDVAIIDINLPDMSGIDLIERL